MRNVTNFRRGTPSPKMTTLKSCLISEEESESIFKTYGSLETRDPHELPNSPPMSREVISYESNSSHKSSSWSAFLHIVCVMAGTGILQLPYALKSGGWFSLAWIFFSGVLVYHSGRFINACLYYDGLNRLNGLIDIGTTAFGKTGKRLVEFSFSTLIIGASGLYLILAADIMLIVDKWLGWTHHEWVIICGVLSCIPFITIKTLKEASLLSLFGVLTTVMMVFVVIVVAYSDYRGLRPSEDVVPGFASPPNRIWISWSTLPLSLASISFSLGGNTVFPHVEHSMKNPRSFNKVLKFALIFVTSLYAIVAAIGYLAYGDKTLSPIFGNLPPSHAVTFAMLMLTIHVLLTLPINMTALALDMEHNLEFTSSNLSLGQQTLYRVTFRTFLSVITIVLALMVPYFDHVVALLGALSNGALVFILPPMFYIKLFGWRSSTFSDKFFALAMFTTGSFVLVVGTTQALVALYNDITS